jgi:prophage maintenance system killer protein
MTNKKNYNSIIIYQTKSGAFELSADISRETIWANRMQMAGIFGVNTQAITKHIQNIYKDKELEKELTSSKMELVQNESGRMVKRQVNIYNLDVLIAVGYRINSVVGTNFRKWATKTLRKNLVDGYTINKNLVAKNYKKFLKAVDDVKKILPSDVSVNTNDILELVNLFADTWLSLDAYDKNMSIGKKTTKKKVDLTAGKLLHNLAKLKDRLIQKGEASDIFGLERESGSIPSIVGNVMQTFMSKDLYESVEEKAAHLLYFMVKNHPFVDGNKRNGAYAFVWFLNQASILNTSKITSPALTALTILVAESNPKDKDKVTQLILSLLK